MPSRPDSARIKAILLEYERAVDDVLSLSDVFMQITAKDENIGLNFIAEALHSRTAEINKFYEELFNLVGRDEHETATVLCLVATERGDEV
ncbi:MAG: hypothetical protein GY832_35135 [Chloroflexi bacterium]|nr:hypothetical protein [Chloroflexota bacterium]